MTRTVKLPKRKIHKTPRLLMIDAYTFGSNEFESLEAQEKSTYYVTFRKTLESINPKLYGKDDNRIVFSGLSRILDYLFYEPVTHEEIDETIRFAQYMKVTSNGLARLDFPVEIWRRVVDEYNGRPPIRITGVREGSVVYPNEPATMVTSTAPKDKKMGVLAAWFESKILQEWASTEMATQLEHWLLYCKGMVTKVYSAPEVNETQEAYNTKVDFNARLMLHNFGDRAGICPQESEWLGETALYTFSGTDTLSGAYQAWKNGGEKAGFAVTVNALAHRNIQSFKTEIEAFRALYDNMNNGDIGSFVADCYDFWTANVGDGKGGSIDAGCLRSLALESKRTGNGKIVVSRPDSGDALEQVMWVCREAEKAGLFEEKIINGKKWKFATYWKFIEGDGMTWEQMEVICDKLLEYGYAPFSWGLFGVGGGLRNGLKRDNTSAKYALCAVGVDDRAVVKFSETLGKTTLPGPFKLLRSKEALEAKKTIAFSYEEGEDALELYFDGSNIWEPFGPAFDYDFWETKEWQTQQMLTMPLSLSTEDNHNYPATDAVKEKRIELLKEYAPKRRAENYS